MEIVVVMGTNKKGTTDRMISEFLSHFQDATVRTFCLPADGPDFCTGCLTCIINDEHLCPHAQSVQEIEEALLKADLLVFASPTYVLHTTGAMKTLLDHLAYRWIPHRPAPEMFTKHAVIITQAAGPCARSAAKDIKDSLSWWGVSDISVLPCALIEDVVWDNLPEKRRSALTKKIQKLAAKCAKKAARTPYVSVNVLAKFLMCRGIQKTRYKSNPLDADPQWWKTHGWLDAKRPWHEAVNNSERMSGF